MLKTKKIKCGVCENRFAPFKKDIYRCLEERPVTDKVVDVIDCPQCGCQNRLAERLKRITPNGQNPHRRD